MQTWADTNFQTKNSHHATTMNIPSPPPNMWQQAATQPFLIQTLLGPAYYNPSDGSLRSAFIPGAVIFPQSTQQQQIPAAASIAPIAPAPPVPAASPTFSAVDQSTFSPSPAMVAALEVLSQHKWRMRNKPFRQQQTLAVSMLHEDPSCDGVVLNIDVTDGGKSHSMRLSIAYEGARLYVDSI
jgi:hypothetical protein